MNSPYEVFYCGKPLVECSKEELLTCLQRLQENMTQLIYATESAKVKELQQEIEKRDAIIAFAKEINRK